MSNTLEINKEAAVEEYTTGSTVVKKLLEKLIGKEKLLSPASNRVRTFEDAYPIFKKMNFKDELWVILQKRKVNELTAHERLMITAEVWRDGWIADYDNTDLKKWWPYFQKTKAGFVFSDSYYAFVRTTTAVGSRLSFPSSEMAADFGKTFITDWNLFLTIKY